MNTQNRKNEDVWQKNLLLCRAHTCLNNYKRVLANVNAGLIEDRKTIYMGKHPSNTNFTMAAVLAGAKEYLKFYATGKAVRKYKLGDFINEHNSGLIVQQFHLYYPKKTDQPVQLNYARASESFPKSPTSLLFAVNLKMIKLFGAINYHEPVTQCYNFDGAMCDAHKLLSSYLMASEAMVKTLAGMAGYLPTVNFFPNSFIGISNHRNHSAYTDLLQQRDRYKQELEKQQLGLQEQDLLAQQRLINIRLTLALVIALGVWIGVLTYRNFRLKSQIRKDALFMREMLDEGESENKRIAMEVNEEVVKGINQILKQFERTPLDSREKLRKLAETAKKISSSLRPHLFEYYGLSESIEQLVDGLRTKSNSLLSVDIKYFRCLSANEELQLYRVIEEGILLLQAGSETLEGNIVIKQGIEDLLIELMVKGQLISDENNRQQAEQAVIRRMEGRIKLINGLIKMGVREKSTYIQIKIPRYT